MIEDSEFVNLSCKYICWDVGIRSQNCLALLDTVSRPLFESLKHEAVHVLIPSNTKQKNASRTIKVCCWDAGIRTPINGARNRCPTIRRHPNICFVLLYQSVVIICFWHRASLYITLD